VDLDNAIEIGAGRQDVAADPFLTRTHLHIHVHEIDEPRARRIFRGMRGRNGPFFARNRQRHLHAAQQIFTVRLDRSRGQIANRAQGGHLARPALRNFE